MMDLIDQDDIPTCRICHCTESPGSGNLVKLISPCHCSGSLKYVHHGCLQQWLDATNSQRCELCKYPFSMSVKYKPLYKWGSLNASPSERRRLICNSVFNLVSMICIFWSIYVLIERASLDARNGQIDWSFYVKISVVTIGLIIGVIFLFVQLKLYFSIFMKWRQSNRIIIIRDANFSKPEAANAAPSNTTTTTNINATNNTASNNNNNNNNSNNNNVSATNNMTNIDLGTTIKSQSQQVDLAIGPLAFDCDVHNQQQQQKLGNESCNLEQTKGSVILSGAQLASLQDEQQQKQVKLIQFKSNSKLETTTTAEDNLHSHPRDNNIA